MKRFFHFLSLIFLISLLAWNTGCQKKGVDVKGQETELTGTWKGTGNALGQDKDYSVDNISISFDSDGSFRIRDVVQNSDIYSGSFSDQTGTLILRLGTGGSHALPRGWVAASDRMELSYLFPSEDKLVLTCQNVSYFFIKDRMTFFWSGSPLLSIVENDIWYTDNMAASEGGPHDPGQDMPPGSTEEKPSPRDSSLEDKTEDSKGKAPEGLDDIPPPEEGNITYILKLYDNYMEIYSLDEGKDNTVRFEGNFFYLYSRDDTFTFYTYHSPGQTLPELFRSLPDGFSRINIDIYPSDDTLVLTTASGKTIFYNNVMYGASYNNSPDKALIPALSNTEEKEQISTGSVNETTEN